MKIIVKKKRLVVRRKVEGVTDLGEQASIEPAHFIAPSVPIGQRQLCNIVSYGNGVQ